MDHLKDGLWSWEDLCGRWFQHGNQVFEVPILQGIQLWILQSNGCLCPCPCLDMNSQDVLLQSSRCWRGLVTFCPMFAEQMPWHFMDCLDVDAHTKDSSVDSISSIMSASSSLQSIVNIFICFEVDREISLFRQRNISTTERQQDIASPHGG